MHVGYEAAFQHRSSYPDDIFMQKELDFCLRAESAGFDSVWLTEHHFSNYGLIPDPMLALSYVAARTSRVKLGTAVLVLPWHDPVRLAEQIILADHLSGGRLVIGIGRGLSKDEFDGLRVPLAESRERFSDHAELILAALETGVAEGGALTCQPRRELRPRPLKSFQGRVFSASVSPESSPLVAKAGLGMMLVINLKPVHLIERDIRRYQQTWREIHGTDAVPPQPLVSVVVVVDESEERALAVARKHNATSHQVAVQHYGMAEPDFGKTKGYEFYRALRAVPGAGSDAPATVIYGNPDQVLSRLAELKRSLGMQGILTIFHGMPDEDGERNLQCFVKHCLAELKSWPAEPTF